MEVCEHPEKSDYVKVNKLAIPLCLAILKITKICVHTPHKQIRFTVEKPRQVSLESFNCDDNILSKKFCTHHENGSSFATYWELHIQRYIDSGSGIYKPPAADVSLTNARKRSTAAHTPPSLLPATKTVRITKPQSVTPEDMDEEIAKHFLGIGVGQIFRKPLWALLCVFVCANVCLHVSLTGFSKLTVNPFVGPLHARFRTKCGH